MGNEPGVKKDSKQISVGHQHEHQLGLDQDLSSGGVCLTGAAAETGQGTWDLLCGFLLSLHLFSKKRPRKPIPPPSVNGNGKGCSAAGTAAP